MQQFTSRIFEPVAFVDNKIMPGRERSAGSQTEQGKVAKENVVGGEDEKEGERGRERRRRLPRGALRSPECFTGARRTAEMSSPGMNSPAEGQFSRVLFSSMHVDTGLGGDRSQLLLPAIEDGEGEDD